ncbi:hypothetical protein, partial [Streptococcus pneumoniae]|uniref:hypothetical protein n=1 Tax=Streptococcus pneumoniae TaxID=1313 RepID=UPI0038B4C6BD
MEDVEKKILYYEIYKAKKEVYEEYQKKNIFTKEAFYNKHKKDIDRYKVVSGKLKKLLSDKEKLSPKKWNEEKILFWLCRFHSIEFSFLHLPFLYGLSLLF